jgi:hypothetical protein
MNGELVGEGYGMSGLFLSPTNPQFLAVVRIEDYDSKGVSSIANEPSKNLTHFALYLLPRNDKSLYPLPNLVS